MTIWVDPPLWPAHGRTWSHLISDHSAQELHDFAARVGIPERSFEGDHYDVPAERHSQVLAAGARLTTATDLARRLQASGLRFRKRRGERPLARVPNGLAEALPGRHVLDVIASPYEPPAGAGAAVVAVSDEIGWLLLVRSAGRSGWAPAGGKRESAAESVRQTAVRELAEETGLRLAPATLEPIGYERITIEPGQQSGAWDVGDNHIGVFGVVLPGRAEQHRVRADAADVEEALWLDPVTARARSGGRSWWPLIEHWSSWPGRH